MYLDIPLSIYVVLEYVIFYFRLFFFTEGVGTNARCGRELSHAYFGMELFSDHQQLVYWRLRPFLKLGLSRCRWVIGQVEAACLSYRGVRGSGK